MAAKKKVDGRTKEGRALKARAEKRAAKKSARGCTYPNKAKLGRPVGGRTVRIGDVVRVTKGTEKNALGHIGNEDGAHWIVFEDRSHLGLRIRKNSVRLATKDEKALHLRKLVAIDVAIETFKAGKYEDDAPEQFEEDDEIEMRWGEGAFPEAIAEEWGLTKAENREIADILVAVHQDYNGEAYTEEKTVTLSTGKQFSWEQSAGEDAVNPGKEWSFAYKPLAVVDVGGGGSDVNDEDDEDENEEADEKAEAGDFSLEKLGVTDATQTDAVQSALTI